MSDLRRPHRRGEEPDPPSIRVVRWPDADDVALRELLAGIEEEGVPASVAILDPGAAHDVAALAAAAHLAARSGTLRVGVALSSDDACVQLAALPADAPPLLHHAAADLDALRRLGQDAARLVKNTPLTPSPTDPTPDRSLR